MKGPKQAHGALVRAPDRRPAASSYDLLGYRVLALEACCAVSRFLFAIAFNIHYFMLSALALECGDLTRMSWRR